MSLNLVRAYFRFSFVLCSEVDFLVNVAKRTSCHSVLIHADRFLNMSTFINSPFCVILLVNIAFRQKLNFDNSRL